MTNANASAVSTQDIKSQVDAFMPTQTRGSWADYQFNKAQTDATIQANWNRANMEYDLYKSNTAYQRAVADMKSAGLNPYLAYSNGGFTPASSSSSAISSSTPSNAKGIFDLINSALRLATAFITRKSISTIIKG